MVGTRIIFKPTSAGCRGREGVATFTNTLKRARRVRAVRVCATRGRLTFIYIDVTTSTGPAWHTVCAPRARITGGGGVLTVTQVDACWPPRFIRTR